MATISCTVDFPKCSHNSYYHKIYTLGTDSNTTAFKVLAIYAAIRDEAIKSIKIRNYAGILR